MKQHKTYSLVLVKYYLKLPALVRHCIEPIQTSSNDNKPVLKIPLVLTFIRLGFLNTNG